MTFALRGRLLLGSGLAPGAAVVESGRIESIIREPREGDLPAKVVDADIISPGLIDLQVNGGFGHEVGDDPDALRSLGRRLPETGVTSFLPTVISSRLSRYAAVQDAFHRALPLDGARPLGLHLEGPIISSQRKGAHPQELIEAGDPRAFDQLVDPLVVRMVTVAPERPGAIELIRSLCRRDIVVSLGHTAATFDDFERGIDAGGTMATHLYNAMSPFGHRGPGAVGASLVDDRVVVGLIADRVHCHLAGLELALRSKGPERIVLVTDMMEAAGMPDGEFRLGGRRVMVEDGAVRLQDRTLAGSVLTLDRAVRNMVAWTTASVTAALRMATESPAAALGLGSRGRLVKGWDADVTLFDGDLQVEATYVGGENVYRRQAAENASTVSAR